MWIKQDKFYTIIIQEVNINMEKNNPVLRYELTYSKLAAFITC